MRIVATTLLGRGTAPVVREALRSVVMLVDACLVIDTGADEADIEEAREAASSKYLGRSWAWRDDFAAARNAALDLAAEVGARWAITVDADERIECPDASKLRAELAAAEKAGVDVLQAYSSTGYAKPRLIRLPCPGRWRGPNHEGLYDVTTRTTRALRFSEARRAPGHLETKWRRNLRTLVPYSAEHPTEARWHYYIAEAHRHLGEHEAAVERYRTCVALDGWDEEAAWAAYRGAELLCLELGRHDEAIALCAAGMARHPGFAELPWIAGIAAQRLGRHDHAVYWAELARVHGEGSKSPLPALGRRIGFREPKALREGPADIERSSLRALGMRAHAAIAELEFGARRPVASKTDPAGGAVTAQQQ